MKGKPIRVEIRKREIHVTRACRPRAFVFVSFFFPPVIFRLSLTPATAPQQGCSSAGHSFYQIVNVKISRGKNIITLRGARFASGSKRITTARHWFLRGRGVGGWGVPACIYRYVAFVITQPRKAACARKKRKQNDERRGSDFAERAHTCTIIRSPQLFSPATPLQGGRHPRTSSLPRRFSQQVTLRGGGGGGGGATLFFKGHCGAAGGGG